MSDSSGMRTAAAAKEIAGSLSAQLGLFAASVKYPAYFAAQIVKTGIQNSAPGIKDDVPACGDAKCLESCCLAHPPFNSIADNSVAQCTRDREAKPGGHFGRLSPAEAKCCKKAGTDAKSCGIGLAEFGGSDQASGFRE
jgi:hypothetical protein